MAKAYLKNVGDNRAKVDKNVAFMVKMEMRLFQSDLAISMHAFMFNICCGFHLCKTKPY